jgi:hypothetical protein
MLIKILGIVIATGRDKSLLSERSERIDPGIAQTTSTGLCVISDMPKSELLTPKKNTVMGVKVNPLVAAIPWPDVGDDSWGQTYLLNAVVEFDSHEWFSICIVDRLKKNLGFMLDLPGQIAYDKLYSLHCVHYSKMHPDVLREIPQLMGHILNCYNNGPFSRRGRA